MKAVNAYIRKEWKDGKQFWLHDVWTPLGVLRIVFALTLGVFCGRIAGEWVSWLYFNTSGSVLTLLQLAGTVLCGLYALGIWYLLVVKPVRYIDKLAALVALAFALLMGYWFGMTLDGREDRAAWLIFIEGTAVLWVLFFGPYALGATVLMEDQVGDQEPEVVSPLEPPADPS